MSSYIHMIITIMIHHEIASILFFDRATCHEVLRKTGGENSDLVPVRRFEKIQMMSLASHG